MEIVCSIRIKDTRIYDSNKKQISAYLILSKNFQSPKFCRSFSLAVMDKKIEKDKPTNTFQNDVTLQEN